MSVWVRSIRWALAALLACLGFIVGIVVVAWVIGAIGHAPASAFQWLIYFGTVLAVVAGSTVAPRDQRRLFGKVVVAILLVSTLGSLLADLLRHAVGLTDVHEIAGVTLGGLSAVRCTRDTPLRSVET